MKKLQELIRKPVYSTPPGYSNATGAEGLTASLTKATTELTDLISQQTKSKQSIDELNAAQANCRLITNLGQQQNCLNGVGPNLIKEEARYDTLTQAITDKRKIIDGITKSIDNTVSDTIRTDPALLAAKAAADAAMSKSTSRSFNLKILAIATGITVAVAGIGYAIHLIRSK